MPGHHQHPENRELSGDRPVKKANDVRFLAVEIISASRKAVMPRHWKGLPAASMKPVPSNAKGEGYGGLPQQPAWAPPLRQEPLAHQAQARREHFRAPHTRGRAPDRRYRR